MNLLRLNEKVYPAVWTYNFLNSEEINKLISYTLALEFTEGLIGDELVEKKKEHNKINSHIKDMNNGFVPRKRQSKIKWISLTKETNWLFKKIIQEVHKVNQENFDYIIKFIENLQFTEYNENQKGFYSKHTDCGIKETLSNYVDIRKISMSIQLSSPKDYEGGELILYHNGDKKVLPKEQGTIIFFSSDLEHEVTPVIKGTRYSLVSWINGPNLR